MTLPKTTPVYLLTLLVASSCAHKDERPEARTESIAVSSNPAPDAGSSIETKPAAAPINAPFSTEIVFRKGSSSISKNSAARLKKLVRSAQKIGEIDEIHAYTWSDQEYPGEQAKKLPKKQKNLALARGEAIRAYLAKSGLDQKLTVITKTEDDPPAQPKASRAAVIVTLKR